MTNPVVGYVAGFTTPEGKTMGHAGAIISGSAGTAQAKKEALEKAGVRVGKTPSERGPGPRGGLSRQASASADLPFGFYGSRAARLLGRRAIVARIEL